MCYFHHQVLPVNRIAQANCSESLRVGLNITPVRLNVTSVGQNITQVSLNTAQASLFMVSFQLWKL